MGNHFSAPFSSTELFFQHLNMIIFSLRRLDGSPLFSGELISLVFWLLSTSPAGSHRVPLPPSPLPSSPPSETLASCSSWVPRGSFHKLTPQSGETARLPLPTVNSYSPFLSQLLREASFAALTRSVPLVINSLGPCTSVS